MYCDAAFADTVVWKPHLFEILFFFKYHVLGYCDKRIKYFEYAILFLKYFMR